MIMDIMALQKEIMARTVPDFEHYQHLMNLSSPFDVAMATNRHGDTSFHVAAAHGCLDVLKYIHDCLRVELNHVNLDGKTALHEAAQHGHVDCARYLLNAGCTIDSLKKADWTPLMLSCTKNNIKMVSLLLNHSASLSVRNKDGWTPFHIACRQGNMDILNILLDASPSCWDSISNNHRSPLHTVALHGHTKAGLILLSRCGYNVNGADSCGVTPLMDAVRGNHLEMTQLLIKYGADIGSKDILGRQALHHGAQAGSEVVVVFLIENLHVDVNIPSDVTMTTPLHYAAKEGQAAVIEVLLLHGANIDAMDKHDRKAIDIARKARTGSKEAVQILTNRHN